MNYHSDFKKKTILVVDDEEEILTFLEFLLKSAGFTTVNARNATEALQQFNSCEFDFVISDIRMPGMNGLGLYEQIRSANHNVPVLFLSGNADLTDEHAKQMGAVAFIKKPFDSRLLVDTIIKNIC